MLKKVLAATAAIAAIGIILSSSYARAEETEESRAHTINDEQEKEKKISFAGFDALAHAGEEAALRAKLESPLLRKDIEEEPVDFYVNDTLIGSAKTDEEGFASLRYTPEKTGNFNVTYQLQGDSRYVPKKTTALLAVRTEEKPVLVTDLDNTVIAIPAYRFLDHDNEDIPPLEGACERLKDLEKYYDIIYLTARDDIYLNVTKEWLAMYGFPRAPVFFCDLSEDPFSQKKYKIKALKELKAKWPTIAVGIGNTVGDGQAYCTSGMKAYILGEHESLPEGAVPVKNWREIYEALKK